MTTPLLIGLSGYARSGKDSAAAALLETGWERRAFADKLRTMAYATNPAIPHRGHVYQLARLVDAYGWERVKDDYPEARAYLQRLGTEGGRDVLGVNVWVDAAMRDLDLDGAYAFTDCRFENEAQAINDRGGVVVRIERPGVGPAVNPDTGQVHKSETALDGYPFDHVVRNDGTLAQLHGAIIDIAVAHQARAARAA